MLIDLRMLDMSIVNSLTSESTTDPLSANMGKVLNDTKQDKLLSSYQLIVDSVNGVSKSSANGSLEAPFLTLSDAYDSLPDFCRDITIQFKSGTYTESSTVDLYKNIVNLTLEPYDNNSVVVFTTPFTVSNSQKAVVRGLTFNINDNTISNAINIKNINFEITNCTFINCVNGVNVNKCNGIVTQCSFENITGSAIYTNDAGLVLVDSCSTVDNVNVGITCNGSLVIRYGENLTGDSEYITLRNGQVITSDGIASTNMFDIAKAYNDSNNYEWPNANAIGDTRSTEEVWLQSMTTYGSYTRYATNAEITPLDETTFWQTVLSTYTHPTYTALTGKPTANLTPGFGDSFTVSQITTNLTGHVSGLTDRNITIPNTLSSTVADGLMSSEDKSKLNNIESNATANTASDATPIVAGTGAAGTSTDYSRADHVHPAQTSVTGNAGTATTLETSRTIDGVSFNGASNIIHYGTCSDTVAAKTVSCTGFTLSTGAWIAVRLTATNTASPSSVTLNVNSTGAINIKYRNSDLPEASSLSTGRTYLFVYDGTYYQLVGDLDTNTEYTHPTTTGYKHIPSGGASGQILGWSSDGTATWITPTSSVTFVS